MNWITRFITPALSKEEKQEILAALAACHSELHRVAQKFERAELAGNVYDTKFYAHKMEMDRATCDLFSRALADDRNVIAKLRKQLKKSRP